MEDYFDAAHRHFEDAKLLHSQNPARLANASHLYGFCGECALKAIMTGNSNRGVARKHLPEIVNEFLEHSAVKGNSRLAEKVKKTCTLGYANWEIAERYASRNAAIFTQERVQTQSEASQKLLNLLEHWKRGRL